jgi:hypothetical protein
MAGGGWGEKSELRTPTIMPAAPLPCSVIRPETLPVNGFLGFFVWELAGSRSPLLQRLNAKTTT